MSLSLRRIDPLPKSLDRSLLTPPLSYLCGSRAVTVRLKGPLLSLFRPLLPLKLESLAALPLLSLTLPTRLSISRYSVEFVVPLLCTPSRSGAVFVLFTEGLGDGRSPRGTVSVLCLGTGDGLELALALDDIDPFRSLEEGASLEAEVLTASRMVWGGYREELGLDLCDNSGESSRLRTGAGDCLWPRGTDREGPLIDAAEPLLSPLNTPAGSAGKVSLGALVLEDLVR